MVHCGPFSPWGVRLLVGFQTKLIEFYRWPMGRPGPTRCRAGPARKASGRHGPTGLTDRAAAGFVLGLRPRHDPMGLFSCRASPWPITLKIPQTLQIFSHSQLLSKFIEYKATSDKSQLIQSYSVHSAIQVTSHKTQSHNHMQACSTTQVKR